MKPRERAGQVSIASAAPAGHSAPMPMPSRARNRNKRKKLGASPARKLQTEYHPIEIISGALRPIRSRCSSDQRRFLSPVARAECDFPLLKTGEWAILAPQPPGFRET